MRRCTNWKCRCVTVWYDCSRHKKVPELMKGVQSHTRKGTEGAQGTEKRRRLTVEDFELKEEERRENAAKRGRRESRDSTSAVTLGKRKLGDTVIKPNFLSENLKRRFSHLFA